MTKCGKSNLAMILHFHLENIRAGLYLDSHMQLQQWQKIHMQLPKQDY